MLVILNKIRVMVDTAKHNKKELVVLQERCTYVTACIITKCKQCPSQVDVKSLIDRVEEIVEEIVEEARRLIDRCGQRGLIWRGVKAKDDEVDIAELHRRIGDLTADTRLVDIVAVTENVKT